MKNLNRKFTASLAAFAIITTMGGTAIFAADVVTEDTTITAVETIKENTREFEAKGFKGELTEEGEFGGVYIRTNLTEEEREAMKAEREALMEELGLELGEGLSREDFMELSEEEKEALKEAREALMQELGIEFEGGHPGKKGAKGEFEELTEEEREEMKAEREALRAEKEALMEELGGEFGRDLKGELKKPIEE